MRINFMIRHILLLFIFLLSTLLIVNNADALSKKCELAERLYLEGDYRGAAYECERLFREYNRSAFRSEAAYLAGLSYLKLDNIPFAKKHFQYVIDNSTDPLLIDEANIGLTNIEVKPPSIKEPTLFSVQVGSFKDKRNAERLYNRFKRRKYTVRIIKEKEDKVTIYKVKIGRFKSKEEAAQFAKKLRKAGYPTAVVGY